MDSLLSVTNQCVCVVDTVLQNPLTVPLTTVGTTMCLFSNPGVIANKDPSLKGRVTWTLVSAWFLQWVHRLS